MNFKRIAKFLMSGGSAAFVEYVIFVLILFIFPSIIVIIPHSISFIAGLLVSFLLNKKWVFRSVGGSRFQLIKYSLLALINLLIGSASIWLFAEVYHINPHITKIITMVIIASWNYIIFSRFIFKNN